MTPAFTKAFEQFTQSAAAVPEWLKDMRAPAFRYFQEHGFPTRKQEAWHYTSLRSVADMEYHWPRPVTQVPAFTSPHGDLESALKIVTVNGRLIQAPKNLPAGLSILSLQDAAQTYPELVKKALSQHKLAGDQIFLHLSQAFLAEGIFIHVAKNAVVNEVLEIIALQMGEGQTTTATFPRLIIEAETGSAMTIVENTCHAAQSTKTLSAPYTSIHVGANAQVRYLQTAHLNADGLHFAACDATLERDAVFENIVVDTQAQLLRRNTNALLKGEGAQATLNGFYLTRGTMHCDQQTTIDHQVPHATSNQLYKGILFDTSRAIFSGQIFVRKHAQQTAAFQLNKNLLMSAEAEADSLPQLAIDANDVKCSHGSATGRLGATELFYLQSRGIPRRQAESMLAEAFAFDVLNKVTHATARDFLIRAVKKQLENV